MSSDPRNAKPESELLALARARDFDGLETKWMERLEAENPDVEELFRVARYLVSRHFEEQAGILLWSLVASVSERQDAHAALAAAKRAAVTAPTEKNLREEVLAHYRQTCGDALRLDQVLTESRLLDTDDVEGALTFIEPFLHLQPGAYVIHRMSRRVGRVKGFEDGVYVIEAETSEYRHEPQHVFQYWDALEADGFRAQIVFEPDALRRLSQEDPERLLRLLLAGHNGHINFKNLKAVLIPAVIPQAQWSQWWATVKLALKRSPWIELSGGTQPTLTLRPQAADYREKLLERFSRTNNPFDKVDQVLAYLGEIQPGNEGDAELARDLGAALLKAARGADPAPALAMLAVAAALRKAVVAAPDPLEALTRRAAEITDAGDLMARIEKDGIARMVLEALRTTCPERWHELYAQALPAASLRMCDWIARELNKAGHQDRFNIAVEKATAMPDDYPLAFGWVWRRVLSEGGPVAEKLNPVSASVILLHLMHRLDRTPKHAANRAESRQVLGKLRNLVGANACERFRKLIERSSVADATRLHEAIMSCEGLTGEIRHELLDILREKHPEQFIEERNLWEDGNLYLTAEGYAKCHAALEKIINEDIQKNAVAIGTAAEKGDLRENWEYKAALEERDRLVERAGRIREQFSRARVLNPNDISGKEVNVGTSVRLRDTATGDERIVTFLGPWDSDIGNGVYSYLAPLSLRFMGKKLGERVRAALGDHEADYEIVAIEKAV